MVFSGIERVLVPISHLSELPSAFSQVTVPSTITCQTEELKQELEKKPLLRVRSKPLVPVQFPAVSVHPEHPAHVCYRVFFVPGGLWFPAKTLQTKKKKFSLCRCLAECSVSGILMPCKTPSTRPVRRSGCVGVQKACTLLCNK